MKDKLTTKQKEFLQSVYRKEEGAKYVFAEDEEYVKREANARKMRTVLIAVLIVMCIIAYLTQCN